MSIRRLHRVRPAPCLEVLEPRVLLAADLVMTVNDSPSLVLMAPGRFAGSWQKADPDPHEPGADVTLSFTDLNGSPITSVAPGDEFQVQIYLQDIRSIELAKAGVISAYLDLEFDSSQLEVISPVEFGDAYQLLPDGGTVTDGQITDINASTNFIDYLSGFTLGVEKQLFATTTFRVNASASEGTVQVSTAPAEDRAAEINFFEGHGTWQANLDPAAGEVIYGSGELTIESDGSSVDSVAAVAYEEYEVDLIQDFAWTPFFSTPQEHGPSADVSLSITDTRGSPITSVSPGDEFQVQIFLQDIREIDLASAGVISAYLNLEFDPTLVEVTRPTEFGDDYDFLAKPGTVTQGQITDINAATNFVDYLTGFTLGHEKHLFATTTFRVNALASEGALRLSTAPSDVIGAEINFFDGKQGTWQANLDPAAGEVIYGSADLAIFSDLQLIDSPDMAAALAAAAGVSARNAESAEVTEIELSAATNVLDRDEYAALERVAELLASQQLAEVSLETAPAAGSSVVEATDEESLLDSELLGQE